MKTHIGSGFAHSPRHSIAVMLVGTIIVATDLAIAEWGSYGFLIEARATLAVLVLALYSGLSDGDARSLGLRLAPIQGWWYWIRAGLAIGAIVGLLVVLGWGAWLLSGRALPAYAAAPPPPENLLTRFFFMCVFTPVLEEAIYRFALCIAIVSFGPWKAIAVSGFTFGLLHVVYGNPSPENLLGGFFIAWAFLKSETIMLPVLLHGLGNLAALTSQITAWYWQTA
ncbi:MAG: CPBP family intramembrane metalloprotease [Planctomycetota bacterium]|nr:CPBP family intramembrane metalloprotease [Planctomycetaceae bacterium]MDQ3331174.1 CPBP family intramembrane metalloprotease [Planctomycetota bacterium]